MELRKMTCIITGAGGALGRQVVSAVLSKGATVVSILRGTSSTLTSIESNYYSIECDLADGQSVNEIFHAIIERTGRIDVLINIAGGYQGGQTLEETSMDDWKTMLAVNFITTLNTCKAVLTIMKSQDFGRIINIGGSSGEEGMALASPYAVSKAAVHALTKSIAKETSDLNINALVLVPGTIDTPQNRQDMPEADWEKWIKPTAIANQITLLLETDKFDPEAVMLYLKAEPEASPSKESEILSVFDHVDQEESPKEEEATLPPTEEGAALPDKEPSPEPSQPVDDASPAPELESPEVLPESATPEDSGEPEPSQPPDHAPPAPEPETPEVPENDPPEDSVEPEPSISPDKASFSMVTYLKTRGLHKPALEMLDMLLEKGEDKDRVLELREEIEQSFGGGEKPIAEKEDENAPIEENIHEDPQSSSPDLKPKFFYKTTITDKSNPNPDKGTQKDKLGNQQGEEVESEPSDPLPELEIKEEDPMEKDKPVEMETTATKETRVEKDQEDQKRVIPGGKKTKISSTLLTLIILLALVSALAIQDRVSPDSSLATAVVNKILDFKNSESVDLTRPIQSRIQSAVMAGFVDTLKKKLPPSSVPVETPDGDTLIELSQMSDTTNPSQALANEIVMDTTQFDTATWEIPAVQETFSKEPVSPEDTGAVMEATEIRPIKEKEPEEKPRLAQEFFDEGLYQEAAQAWYREKKSAIVTGQYTITLEYVCMDSTVRSAHKVVKESNEFFVLPKTINSRNCYIVCLGEYPDWATAKAALLEVPAWFVESGAKPTVRLLARLLK